MKSVILSLALLFSFSLFAKEPTVSLYKVLRDGQRRDTSYVALNKQEDGSYELRVSKEELKQVEFLQVVPSMAVGHQGEKGYFINNNSTVTYFDIPHTPVPYKKQWEEKYLVSGDFKDITDGVQFTTGWDEGELCASGYHENDGSTWLAIKEGLKFESRQLVKLKKGEYSLIDVYYLKDVDVYEDLTILYYPVKGDTYTDIALAYRQWLIDHHRVGEMVKDKILHRSEIAYGAEAPEIRIRMGWKESPSPILEQTRENEPPMHVAITFDRVCDIIDALVKKGVKKAQLCLVGWNISGHDGRFPEILPPDPAFGGYKGLKKVLKKAEKVGYRIDLHNNRTDIYSICEDWNNGYHACKDPRGQIKSKFVYGGGMMYDICLKQSYEVFFKRDEPKLVKLGVHGIHFIDVLSIMNPHDCFDPNHPTNKKEAAYYAEQMLKESQSMFGGSQSEGGKDWIVKSLDYTMYASRELHRPKKNKILDAYLPMWHLVFNGYIMSNPSNTTVNFTIKPIEDAMKVVELAARPMFYFYSSFKAKMSQNWMGGELDLRCGTDEELDVAATEIKKGYDLFQQYKHLLKETLDKHESLAPNVYCSTFSNGEQVVCNYTNKPFNYKGVSVKAEGFHIFKK